MKEEYTVKDVVKFIPGLSRDKFKEWVFRGYIKPYKKAEGPGLGDKYGRLEVYVTALFDILVKFGFHRRKASLSIHGFTTGTDEKRKERLGWLDKADKHLWLVFFKRPVGGEIMKSNDPKRPFLTQEGRLVSDKALAPGVRIIEDKDISKSFSTLFLTYDDEEKMKDFDLSGTEPDNIHIVNFKKLKMNIDDRIKRHSG